MDFSKYSTSTYESDGLRDAQIAEREKYRGPGFIDSLPPRARNCVNSIQIGAKMGASVGGCFGLLTGLWVAVTQRNPLVLPISVVGGAVSFGFFLACGMIIRCEEQPRVREILSSRDSAAAQAHVTTHHSSIARERPSLLLRRAVKSVLHAGSQEAE